MLSRRFKIDHTLRFNRFTTSEVFLMIAFIPFMDISILEIGIGKYLLYFVAFIVMACYFLKKYKRILWNVATSSFFRFFVGYELVVFVSTFRHGIDVAVIYNALSAFLVLNIIEIEQECVEKVLYRIYAILALLNLLTFVFLGALLPADTILGGKNAVLRVMLPALCIFFEHYKKEKDMMTLLLIMITALGLVLPGSGNAIAVCLLAFVFFFLPILLEVPAKIYVTVYLVLEVVIVLFSTVQLNWVLKILALLGKGNDFNGRVVIWNRAIDSLKGNLLVGIGRNQFDFVIYGMHYIESHNMVLQILLDAGMIGLILYLAFVMSALNKNAIEKIGDQMSFYAIGVLLMLISGYAESIQDSIGTFIIIGLAYSVGRENRL